MISIDQRRLTKNAFCHDRNKKRYLSFTQRIAKDFTISSRKITFVNEIFDDDRFKYDFTHRLQLIFDQKSKKSIRKYSFDINSQICDILLNQRNARDISELHFCIIFDDTIDENEKHFILKNSSINEMIVDYNDQATEKMRHHFIWILNLKKKKKKWEIEIHIQKLEFKVELISHNTCKVKYDKNVKNFLINSRTAFFLLDMLEIDNYTIIAQFNQFFTFKKYSIYIRERKLRSDAFEKMNKVIDVSIDVIYVRKEFYESQWEKNNERRKQQKKNWLNQIDREIRIMRKNLHVSMITHVNWMKFDHREEKHRSIVNFRKDSVLFLMMSYFFLENLKNLHDDSFIAVKKILQIFAQILKALQYLHSRDVTHRDLKSKNILIESRFSLSIKLTDFDLANDKLDWKIVYDTQQYTTLEIYLSSRYTTSMNLWWIKMIILQYMYELFKALKQREKQNKNSSTILRERELV